MKRRSVLKAAAVAPVAVGVSGQAWAAPDPLAFDRTAYTVLTTTVATAAGPREVTYRFYRAVAYVAKPVDAKYQCLNVSVPVEIDGKPVDASNAPILFSNSVGGYLPSSVADAPGVGGPPRPGPPGGDRVDNATLAVAAGYVVVEPGARGRTLVDANGTFYGTAPAAIVDLKAAVRYVRYNQGRIPGNTDRIVTTGVSAGGALSSLLGASGHSPHYAARLRELGAAQASDAVFASAAYCPIIDLEHSDMAYEWNWGGNPLSSGAPVDPAISRELRTAFTDYQASLRLRGKNGFGTITTGNYGDYLTRTFLRPAATRYLQALSADDHTAYLAANPWLKWNDDEADFTWANFLRHVGPRKKNAPAFDAFDLSSPENNLFGTGTTAARHFTRYSLRKSTGDDNARLDRDLPGKLDLMNPMHFLGQRNPARARHWWIRVGTLDTDTSLTVVGNLASAAENLGDDVNAAMYWDAGHGANEDAAEFITWIGAITGRRG